MQEDGFNDVIKWTPSKTFATWHFQDGCAQSAGQHGNRLDMSDKMIFLIFTGLEISYIEMSLQHVFILQFVNY